MMNYAAKCSRLRRTHATTLMAITLALVASSHVRADEGGVAFWLSGQYPSLAAVPSTPGWSLVAMPYYYNGSGSGSKSFAKGDSLVTNIKSQSPLLILQPGYAPETQVAGGQLYIGLGFGYGRNSTQADVSPNPRGTGFGGSDSVWGWTDLSPVASLAWTRGVNNWMTYLMGNIPVGTYDSTRLANIGIGHGAIDGGGGYTYLDADSGREFSAVAGITYNWKNGSTGYRNGVDSHLDWAASQFLSAEWQIGVGGYVYYQLSNDSYPTDGVLGELKARALGGFKSRIASIGPQVGYLFKINGQDAYLNVRGYGEFWAEHRIEGYALFATLSIPLGGKPR